MTPAVRACLGQGLGCRQKTSVCGLSTAWLALVRNRDTRAGLKGVPAPRPTHLAGAAQAGWRRFAERKVSHCRHEKKTLSPRYLVTCGLVGNLYLLPLLSCSLLGETTSVPTLPQKAGPLSLSFAVLCRRQVFWLRSTVQADLMLKNKLVSNPLRSLPKIQPKMGSPHTPMDSKSSSGRLYSLVGCSSVALQSSLPKLERQKESQ